MTKRAAPRLGVHTGIAGGIPRSIAEAEAKGCATWQIFSRNPRGWTARPLDDAEIRLFREAREKAGLDPCVIHSCYLINLAASDPVIRAKSIAAFRDEIDRGLLLGADYLVVHPGSARGASVEQALINCVSAVREASKGREEEMLSEGLEILIENTAGQGGQIGRTFDEVKEIISGCDGLPVGMCLDTAHAFAAGYDWREKRAAARAFRELGEKVGYEKVKVIHFNDSKAAFGSRVDRHWHIGEGEIGSAGLARLLNHAKLRRKAFILETPQDDQKDDVRNLAAARALIA